MVLYIVGPALVVASIVVVVRRGTDAATGKPKPRNWPLAWLLFWLGMFSLRLWAFLVQALFGVLPVGKLLGMSSSSSQSHEPTAWYVALFQAALLLAVAVGGYRLLTQYRAKLPD